MKVIGGCFHANSRKSSSKGNCLSSVKKAFRSPSKTDQSQNITANNDTTSAYNVPLEKGGEKMSRWSKGKKSKNKRSSLAESAGKLREAVLCMPENSALRGFDTKAEEETDAEALAEGEAKAKEKAETEEVVEEIVSNVVVYNNQGDLGEDSSNNLEKAATLKIQSAFRGYTARRSLRALRGPARLRALVKSHGVERQAMVTNRCIQDLLRVQTKVRSRRVQTYRDHFSLRHQKYQEQLAWKFLHSDGDPEDGWDDSIHTVEEIELKKQSKQEAAVKRERAMAYAYSHQLCRSPPSRFLSLFIDFESEKPDWGWIGGLERWAMSGRQWEIDMSYTDHISYRQGLVKQHSPLNPRATKVGIDMITNIYKQGLSKPASPITTKVNGGGEGMDTDTKGGGKRGGSHEGAQARRVRVKSPEEEQKSTVTKTSSVGSRQWAIKSPARRYNDNDNESCVSAIPNYMITTESAKAKARSKSFHASVGARKRLTFPPPSELSVTPRSTRSSASVSSHRSLGSSGISSKKKIKFGELPSPLSPLK